MVSARRSTELFAHVFNKPSEHNADKLSLTYPFIRIYVVYGLNQCVVNPMNIVISATDLNISV